MALQSIRIATPPTKTDYIAGEAFNPAGMVVEANFGGGTIIEASGYTVSPSTMAAIGTEVRQDG